MRDYAKIAPTIWTGTTGRKLRDAGRDAQVVAFYLMTCPHSNMIGLYYLPLPVLAHETGIDLEGASKALRRVSETGFARFEGVLEHIFVPEMAAWQIGEPLDEKDNRVKGIIKDWQAMRKSSFFMDFYHRYRESFHLPDPSPLQGASKPLRSQEQEQEKEKEQKEKSAPPDGGCPESLKPWLAWWNGLRAEGLVPAGVDETNPSKAVVKAYRRVSRSKELRDLFADRQAIEVAIRKAPFLRQGWFRLEKLFGGSNREGELVIRKLLEGGYEDCKPEPKKDKPQDPGKRLCFQ